MSEGSIGMPCEFIAKGFGVQVNPATEIELSTDGVKNFVHVWCTKCRWLRMITQQKIIALQSGGYIFTLYFRSREKGILCRISKTRVCRKIVVTVLSNLSYNVR